MSNSRVPHSTSSRMTIGHTHFKRPGGTFLCNIALLSRLKRVTAFLDRSDIRSGAEPEYHSSFSVFTPAFC